MSISVLTICRNDVIGLKKTIASVQRQVLQPSEHIIIDGGSSDGTVEFLATQDAPYMNWVSEADEGISDAFNKAFRRASSKWIVYLNAGDVFSSPDVLVNVSKHLSRVDADVAAVCGNVDLIDDNGIKRAEIRSNSHELQTSCCIAHQASFIRRSVQESYPYDKRLRTGMDYDFWLRVQKRYALTFVDEKFADCSWGGVSTSDSWKEHQFVFDHLIRILNSKVRVSAGQAWQVALGATKLRYKNRLKKLVGNRGYELAKAVMKAGKK